MKEAALKRSPQESVVTATHLVLPEFTNARGTIFGGQLMAWMDIAAAICAIRHCRVPCVTVSVDQLNFIAPVLSGHICIITARMTYIHVSSMEIFVQAESESPLTGERTTACSAYFTFVAKSDKGKVRVPQLLLETALEKKDFENGAQRRKRRLQNAQIEA